MIEKRDATPADVDYVTAHMWERGKREGKRIGFENEAHIQAHLKSHPPKYFYTLVADGNPMVVMGAESHDNVCYTWFIATKEFTRHGLAVTKFMNRFTKQWKEESGEDRLELWSASDHPMAEKWFNVLGFYRYGADDTFNKYLYNPENLVADKI